MDYITVREIYEINAYLVKTFGGAGIGVKDTNLAESAINSVFQNVFGEELYPSIEDKIAYTVYSIIANHIFVDGNKRTGICVLRLLIDKFNLSIIVSDDDFIDIALKIAMDKWNNKDLANWLRSFNIIGNKITKSKPF